MTREHRGPAGPRPANQSPTRRSRGPTTLSNAAASSRRTSTHGPILSATSSNNHSLFSFGRNGNASTSDRGDTTTTTTSYDFLPSVSFDDLQSSLESASTDFKLTQFPSPTGEGSILESNGMAEREKMGGGPPPRAPAADREREQQHHHQRPQPRPSNVTQTGGTTRVAIPPSATRPARSGSILRRPSTSNRQVSNGSTVSSSSGVVDIPTAPAAMRARRQSHYPPVSNSNIGKPPRKSIGPGVIETDYGARSQRRRPSVASNSDRLTVDTTAILSTAPVEMEVSGSLTAPTRASKARSLQPMARTKESISNHSLTPEQNRTAALSPRSPRVGGNKARENSQGPGKRVSVMPGMPSPSHLTGLGARTISPTDTRRLKRISQHPTQSLNLVANALPTNPPPPVSLDARSASRSPSMIPRKATATPSSSRTTPDINRKSYSSGLSVNSNTSYRTSTGSIQPRIPQSHTTSRLPAPKSLNLNQTSGGADNDEDVPPVPAIPKAYESPKVSPNDSTFTDKKKTGLLQDSSSINSNSTSTSVPAVSDLGAKLQRKNSARKSSFYPSSGAEGEKASGHSGRKNLQPLRMPPMTVAPLSTPTAAKIAALQQQNANAERPDRDMSPPRSKQIKTPTTPMTASKSSFFSRNRPERSEHHTFRSSSSIHPQRVESPTQNEATSSSESLMGPSTKASRKPSISPFLSSSVPKGGLDHGFMKRSRTGADFATITESSFENKTPPQKPTGPRAQREASAMAEKQNGKQNEKQQPEKSGESTSSPEEPPTPGSMSSLRRKLSLTWKRNNSKGNIVLPPGIVDKAPEHNMRQESMPPPRIPMSTTMGSFSNSKPPSPTPSVKTTSSSYLETRRRKSSASSLNTFVSHDRTRSDTVSWGINGNTKKPPPPPPQEPTTSTSNADRPSASRNSSVMQKILKPKSSSGGLRSHHQLNRLDSFTADLDKDDLAAEEEMRKMGSRRKETEIAARTLDALKKRATPKERVSAQEAIRIAMLNIYERGEIIDYQDIYFCGTQNARKVVGDLHSSQPNFGYDDDRGDYTIVPGDHLAYRYEIIDVLGKGSFGQVVRCIDHRKGALVAIKIIRNKKRFHQQALVEVNILKKLRDWDPENKHSMVSFTDSFYFRGHLCLSTELLDMNLYEFIKANAFRGFSLKLIRRFTKQMLSSLNLLRQHRVIHCDLKPENILLRHPLHSEIKVIDFGSSCFENEKVYTYIQSRFYRSPEVILGMTYGMPIDMWSLGCILAELYTGVPIFPGENEQEQLACIMEVFGPPEKHLIEKSTRKKLFFDSMGKPRLTVSSKGRRRRPSSKTLQQVLKCDDDAFLDFIARCLRWDPERRLRPDDAARHEFITGVKVAPVPRMPARDTSPSKRSNTVSGLVGGGAVRPLPEPPTTGGSGFKAGSMRTRDLGVSPHKPFSGVAGARRTSAANGSIMGGGTTTANKRVSTGSTSAGITIGTSNLPRAAGRSVSARQDLASAGATMAMGRRN